MNQISTLERVVRGVLIALVLLFFLFPIFWILLMSFQTTAIRQYASPGGVIVLGIGAGVCVAAYAAMMRIGRLPVEKRILS